MKRQDFLKILGASGSTFLLGNAALSASTISLELRRIVIYDNFVRGVNFHRDAYLNAELKLNKEVQLVRAVDNVYDQFAISVQIDEVHIGYIAAYENVVLANMLESGVQMHSYISELREVNADSYLKDVIAIRIETELMVPIGTIDKVSANRADNAIDVYRQGRY
jgi:hypothetical protein